jgi:hypothetical protein
MTKEQRESRKKKQQRALLIKQMLKQRGDLAKCFM